MRAIQSTRGFTFVMHPEHVSPHEEKRLISESSAIGDYDDSLDIPGSSYLWVGEHHHLDREQVGELIARMQYWLDHKRLAVDSRPAEEKPE